MKKGFTLAEVLITLGIIGVVAAMTVPSLISSANRIKFKSGFKKYVSLLSQTAQMSSEKYGFDYAGITQTCSNNGGNDSPLTRTSICAMINGTIQGATYYEKATDIKMKKGENYDIQYAIDSDYFTNTVTSLNNISNAHVYQFADGTLFAFHKDFGKTPCNLGIGIALKDVYNEGVDTSMNYCYGFIDVNGPSLPNKEVSCSSGENKLEKTTCIVKNDSAHLTDIYPVRFHNGIVEPATAAARYVLKSTK